MNIFLLPIWCVVIQAAEPVDFVRDVRPIFEKHCYDCHGEDERESGFRLDIKEFALKGGDNHGPDIIPGNALDSPLIHFITSDDDDEVMPPDGKLAAAEIDILRRWVNEGAVWPDGVDLVEMKDTRDHWSFKALQPPVVANKLNLEPASPASIDALIDTKLAENGLEMSPAADRVSWLRRVHFDLIGLPPTPEQVRDFLGDDRNDAFERVVDGLLSSQRYGERWAQHWLDLVRYADTHGFEVNTERPNAWPYRDYVIRSFNDDKPYDQFIREQIVGDALGEDAATGFLVTASVLLPAQIGQDAPSMRLARQDSIDEVVNNIGQTFLGLSVGCARCHDHKFDPITAKDYYAMQAFVAGVEYEDRKIQTPGDGKLVREAASLRKSLAKIESRLTRFAPLARPTKTLDEQADQPAAIALRPALAAAVNTDRIEPAKTTRLRFSILSTDGLEPCLDELEVFDLAGENVALASYGTKVTTSGDTIVADRHDPAFVNDGQYGNSRSWMSNTANEGWVELQFPREVEIERIVWGRDREKKFSDRSPANYRIEIAAGEDWKLVADSSDRSQAVAETDSEPDISTTGLTAAEATEASKLMATKEKLKQELQQIEVEQVVFAGKFRTPDEIHLLLRGDPEQPQEKVAPAIIEALGDLTLSEETPEQERRLALANWIADPANPLTARVMVNRIWQGHFGTGLVPTPSDFGNNGIEPTHPELLDWLANELIRSGWSIKHMHRLIVLSKTYRQSSKLDEAAAKIDADVQWLWRYPSRRVEAEAIRDSMLAVSGLLDLKMYGRGYDSFNLRGGLEGFQPVEELTTENQRRMIYAHKVRRETEAVFGAFDCPDGGQGAAVRIRSTTPIQALNLFNSQFTLEVSQAFSNRIEKEGGNNVDDQIQYAYQWTLNRAATAAERDAIKPIIQEHGIALLCRVLFNSNEFLFIP